MSTPSSEPQAAADLPSSQVSGSTTNTSTSTSTSTTQGEPANDTSRPSALQRLREWLDRLLVADVFLVLAGALWFAVAVVLHSQGVEAPLATFQKLWEPLFTPAIGLLMAAALLSGALGWWQRRGQR
jgi:Mn2+/Fe2+ NRAMP family transporter